VSYSLGRRWALVLAAADLALLGAGVAFAAGRGAAGEGRRSRPVISSPAARPPSAGHPSPRRTVLLPPRRNVAVGQTVTITDPTTGAALQIEVGAPTASAGALGSYGYGPQEGLYLTFPITVRDTGRAPVLVEVLDFLVDEPGLPGRNVYDGNSPYSGAPRQLDNTVLAPGQAVSGVLTYDEPARHGVLRWVIGNATECSWSF
jgi:hypothetical protein